MILLINNYDSFTWNLVHLLAGRGEEVVVRRNDALDAAAALAMKPAAIVLSPGPCTPNEAGVCLELVSAAEKARTPLFGVCLGMQAIAQAGGGRIVRAGTLMHGKTSRITHAGRGLFEGLPEAFIAARYHSLIADPETLPSTLAVTATSADDDEIMAIEYQNAPIAGVQFHPESIASEHGGRIVRNFLAWSGARR